MPDDQTELDAALTNMQGIKNHPHGFMLLRLARLVKAAAARLRSLEDRVSALEGKRP